MDRQLSFASLDYAGKKKRTKRDVFLAEMAAAVPWSILEAVIEPHYPRVGPQGGASAVPDRRDVAHLLLVQFVGSGRRGSALRHPVDARVLQSRTWPRSDPRRDDDLELPASARSPWADEDSLRSGGRTSRGARRIASRRHDRRRDTDRRLCVHEERGRQA